MIKNEIKEGLWIPFMGEIGRNKKMEEFEDEDEDEEVLNTEEPESKEDDCRYVNLVIKRKKT